MTATQPTPIPWRVKLCTDRRTWFSPEMTEAQAVTEAGRIGDIVDALGGGCRTLPFATCYGVDARIRVSAIVSIEPVGPRWDGVDDNDRPRRAPAAPDVVPAAPDPVPTRPDAPADDRPALVRTADDQPLAADGTRWLQTRDRQRQSRERGRR